MSKKNKSKRKKKGYGQRPLIALCMIARDEAVFLEQCLQSVAGWVDEVVIVDTGSCDDTVAIGRRFGVQVVSQAWQDDFARARNTALDLARAKWILVLDCDEVLARQDRVRLEALLVDADADAYRMTTYNYSNEANRADWVSCQGLAKEEKGYPGYFPTTKVRLWRNRRGVRFEGAVHELVEPCLMRAGLTIGDCPVPVHHYGYIEKTRSKDRILEGGERKVRDNPEDLQARYELALAYRECGLFSEALANIEVAISGIEKAEEETNIYLREERARLVQAELLSLVDRPAHALEAYDAILTRFPDSFEALNCKGHCLEKSGRIDEALCAYRRGLEVHPGNKILSENLDRLQDQADSNGWETFFRTGHRLYASGQRDSARQYFAQILAAEAQEVEPAYLRRAAATLAGRCFLEEERYDEAIVPLDIAYGLAPDDKLTLLSLGDTHVKLGLYEQALAYLRAGQKGDLDNRISLEPLPIDYSLHFFTGQALHELGRTGDAEAAFICALKLAPERTEAAQALNLLRQNRSGTGLYIESQVESVPESAGSSPMQPIAGAHRLTLCMIVRDEEERLGRCLESVQGLVDEIVVVDTGSSDGTVALAEGYGAKIGHFSWCDDFAAARNASLALATGDFVLWLDADDILPGECHAEIRRLVDLGGRKSYFFVLDDQGYESVSCLQMRLFPKLPGVEFELPIHEQVTPSLDRLGIEMVSTDLRVVHTGYASPEIVQAKKDRYLGIMERWLVDHPEDYMTRSNVALTYYSTERLAEAEAAYRRIADESTCRQDRNWIVYATALLFRGRTLMKMGELEDAKKEILRAEAVDSEYVLTKLSLAEVHARLHEWEEALNYADATVALDGQKTFFPIDSEEIRYVSQLICGQAAQALERWEEAETAYRRAAEVPVARRSEALGNLANMLTGLARKEEALGVLEEASVLDPENSQHLFNKGVWHLEASNIELAEALFRSTLEVQADCAPALLNLGYIAKRRGEFEQAERLYRSAVACDVAGVEAKANLAHLYLELDRFVEAGVFFAQVRERQAGLIDIDLGLMVVRVQQADFAAGAELFEAVAERFNEFERRPGDLDTPGQAACTALGLGEVLLKRGLTKCAELSLLAAIVWDQDLLEARRRLAEVFYLEGNFWKAVSQLESVLLVSPRDGAAFKCLGDCYRQLGVEAAARECYARSGKAAPGPNSV